MTTILKRAALVTSIILVSPLYAIAQAGWMFRGDELFAFGAQTLSLVPGLPGDYLRLAFYFLTLERTGKDVRVGFGSVFSKRGAEVGNRVNIGGYCILGNASIGDDVLIASRVSLLSGKYQHGGALVAAASAPQTRIRIGDRTWIGEGAIVAADVGKDCVVAAGSVVMRDVPDGYMAAGNPARLMKLGSSEHGAESVAR